MVAVHCRSEQICTVLPVGLTGSALVVSQVEEPFFRNGLSTEAIFDHVQPEFVVLPRWMNLLIPSTSLPCDSPKHVSAWNEVSSLQSFPDEGRPLEVIEGFSGCPDYSHSGIGNSNSPVLGNDLLGRFYEVGRQLIVGIQTDDKLPRRVS